MAQGKRRIRPLRIVAALGAAAWLVGVGALSSGLAPTELELLVAPEAAQGPIKRGPYLQNGSSSAMTVRWRTETATDSVVRYGRSVSDLNLTASVAESSTEHVVRLEGLSAGTRYYYSVGNSQSTLAGGDVDHSFVTSPVTGVTKRTRMWVIGDSGTPLLAAVRDAYARYAAAVPTDVFLMLGDNAYPDGTDWQYQAVVFNILHDIMRQTPVWPTLGNHDAKSAASADESGVYYDVFSLPADGEAGGVASGTEAYYAFDYGNIHFVCLNSQDVDRSATGAMLQWLQADLADTTQDWVIAFFHHPPYSKGSHDSDEDGALIDMREQALPILESYGVDLVLAGHSHAYERSYLVDGHYGDSTTFTPSMILNGGNGRPDEDGPYAKGGLGQAPHDGAVYVVAGNSGVVDPEGRLNHPAMYVGLKKMGSMVLDVDNNVLDAKLLGWQGDVLDSFTLLKGADLVPEMPGDLRANVQADGQVTLSWRDLATNESSYIVERSPNGSGWMTLANLSANSTTFIDTTAPGQQIYAYRVHARNIDGQSPWAVATLDGGGGAGCASLDDLASKAGGAPTRGAAPLMMLAIIGIIARRRR